MKPISLYLSRRIITILLLFGLISGRQNISAQQEGILIQLFPWGALNSHEGQPLSYQADYADISSWYRDYPAFLNAGFDLSHQNWRGVVLMEIRPNLFDYLRGNDQSNLPFSIDSELSNIAFAAYSGEVLDFSLGRRKIKMGPGEHSFFLSHTAPGYDHILAALTFPGLSAHAQAQWIWTVITSDNTYAPSNMPWPPGGDDFQKVHRTYANHIFAYGTDRWRISLADSSLTHGDAPNLQDISPGIAYHGLYQKNQNVMFTLSGEVVAGPARLHSTFTLDDLRFFMESPESNPTAIGISAGAEMLLKKLKNEYEGRGVNDETYTWCEKNLAARGALKIGWEGYWCSPWMYHRHPESLDGQITYTVSLNALGMEEARQTAEYPYGFPGGPDVILNRLRLTGESRRLRAHGLVEWQVYGGNDLSTEYSRENPLWYNWSGWGRSYGHLGTLGGKVEFLLGKPGSVLGNTELVGECRLTLGTPGFAYYAGVGLRWCPPLRRSNS